MNKIYVKNKLRAKLYQGDCLDILPRLKPGLVDLVLTDPPYGTTSCKWDSIIPLDKMWFHLLGAAKDSAAFVFTSSQPYTSALVMSNPKMFKHEWIWIKNRGSNFANTLREPMKEHETVLVFSKGKWVYNKQMQPRTGAGLDRAKHNVTFKTSSENYRKFDTREQNKISEMRVPSSWQKINTVTGKEKVAHPTQKPVELMEYFIKTYTNENDIVLDFTMGSGTTGVACANLNRRFIGIELEPKYFDVAKSRIEKAFKI